jgi:type IV secretion system protein TrbG
MSTLHFDSRSSRNGKSLSRIALLLLVASVGLGACAAGPKPAPQISLNQVPKARPVPEPPKPVQIVEVPKLLPLPGQLKPLPAADYRSTDPKAVGSAGSRGRELVNEANAAARVEPSKPGFLNAMQIWPYSPGALYQVYTSPGRVTDIALEPGEELRDMSTPDTVRWVIGDTESGAVERPTLQSSQHAQGCKAI